MCVGVDWLGDAPFKWMVGSSGCSNSNEEGESASVIAAGYSDGAAPFKE